MGIVAIENGDQPALDAREAAIALREQAAAQAPAPVPTPSTVTADAIKALGKDFMASMYGGDDDAAISKLVEVVTAASAGATQGREVATPVDVRQVAAQVRQSIKRESALEKAGEAYPEVFKNETLAAHADALLDVGIASGKTYEAALDDACFSTRNFVRTAAGLPG